MVSMVQTVWQEDRNNRGEVKVALTAKYRGLGTQQKVSSSNRTEVIAEREDSYNISQ